jgi:hypothetical protein
VLLALPVVGFAQKAQAALQAQQPAPSPPTRDAQAMSIVNKAISALAQTLPSDTSATGAVTIVAGSKTEQGTIKVLTRSFDQTSEEVDTPDGTQIVIFSQVLASKSDGTTVQPLNMELAATSECPEFPLSLLMWSLSFSDTSVQYVNTDNVSGSPAVHVRLWNTFYSIPRLQRLSQFSIKDFWFDPVSGLPVKLSYTRYPAGGNVPGILVEVDFADYQNVQGLLYPHLIKKSLNGTPWMTITIENVNVNTGLSDQNFPLQ